MRANLDSIVTSSRGNMYALTIYLKLIPARAALRSFSKHPTGYLSYRVWLEIFNETAELLILLASVTTLRFARVDFFVFL